MLSYVSYWCGALFIFHLAVVLSMPADSVRTSPADFWAGVWCVVEGKMGCCVAFLRFPFAAVFSLVSVCWGVRSSVSVYYHNFLMLRIAITFVFAFSLL